MEIKKFVVATTVVSVLALVLIGAWIFDPSSMRERERQDPHAIFSYTLPETDSATGDILISCNEEVLEIPTSEFAKWRGLSGVPLALPGGPMTIARLDDVAFSDTIKPAQRAAVEVLKRYSPKRVVFVTHDMCLYYDTIAAWNDKLSQAHQHQASDLETAMRIAREWFPKAEVSGYNARTENNKLVFRPVIEPGR